MTANRPLVKLISDILDAREIDDCNKVDQLMEMAVKIYQAHHGGSALNARAIILEMLRNLSVGE